MLQNNSMLQQETLITLQQVCVSVSACLCVFLWLALWTVYVCGCVSAHVVGQDDDGCIIRQQVCVLVGGWLCVS